MNVILGKACTRCKVFQPSDAFSKRRGVKDGLNSWCKACQREHMALRYKADPEAGRARAKAFRDKNPQYGRDWAKKRHRPNRLMELYDLTMEEYDAMVEAQGGGCAICGGGPDNKQSFNVDHDHDTGLIRGILCGRCNRGLGQFKDQLDLLQSAVRYMERSK